ncbi:DMT family transporter [Pseudoalteromonas denitrificans]|uniref:Permease of the drug/metabolite transporter (DMT) superfamily n=1 Tax=Pseudoalteromonas denitrificans DSM 6059 TaxID=1123010 RepID=A0A1I1PZ82_9GAMM|nr:DMT family transporter [Pseudoalteromonas denitrificans]SFD15129.1 Permease of the drug/metabolite transporter (DMT) superfamily [Pseudoalteromonas denitrificans DSM 6059]
MSAILYALMIFVWGFSWIAIKWQQGNVPMEVSILYRFSLAVVVMFVIGKLFNKLQRVHKADQKFFALQGLCLFCCNFLFFYSSTAYIASGLTAVVMATAPIFNAIHGRIFYGTPPNNNFWLGVIIGLMGICSLFAGDLLQTNWSKEVLLGLFYALAGTWCFSIGNMISIRNTKNNVQPFTATSYAMLYGCAALFMIILFKDLNFEIMLELRYLASLAYLAVPATVIGFTVYLLLVDRIGANNAAYLLVITPIVALVVSSIFENYQWTIFSTLGLLCVVLGNVITQIKKPLLSYIVKPHEFGFKLSK